MKRSELKDDFLRGYLDATLFTTDQNPPSGCHYVESGRAAEMFPKLPQRFIDQARLDCHKFKLGASEYLEQAGSEWENGADFWYTRNGHGVGFWDRGYDEKIADVLSVAARCCGTHDLMPEDISQESGD